MEIDVFWLFLHWLLLWRTRCTEIPVDRAHMDGLSGALIRVSCSTVGTVTAYTVLVVQVLRNKNGCGQFYCYTCASLNL